MDRPQARFEPTYKELKHIFIYSPHKFHLFVLSLPIRNWNTIIGSTYPNSSKRFEPTYKELKLQMHIHFTLYHTSFEPTYKELKHAS